MKAFGIEVRKSDNIKNLYRDVDSILHKSGVDGSNTGLSVQRQTVAHSLQKMLNPSHWVDVCTIKKCAEVCAVCIPKERMDIYSAVHCMHYNEMTPEYQKTIMAMILDDFRGVLDFESTEQL